MAAVEALYSLSREAQNTSFALMDCLKRKRLLSDSLKRINQSINTIIKLKKKNPQAVTHPFGDWANACLS